MYSDRKEKGLEKGTVSEGGREGEMETQKERGRWGWREEGREGGGREGGGREG